jgi:hypothetical protein
MSKLQKKLNIKTFNLGPILIAGAPAIWISLGFGAWRLGFLSVGMGGTQKNQ